MSSDQLNRGAGHDPDAGHGQGSEDVEVDEVERPRLEDSRASPLHLPHDPPYDLLMMLPQCRSQQDPLLSSTMMQEAGLEHDWPNASSIRLANSRDSVGLSERLNNADIFLDASTTTDVSALSNSASASVSASASAAAIAVPATAAAASADPDAGPPSASSLSAASGDATSDASIESISASDSEDPESSPRLRVLARAAVDGSGSGSGSGTGPATGQQHQHQQQQQLHQHQHQHEEPQHVLGLLQVCRLTLDVLSEGGLLCEDARRWLTPELLCDKLCDRLYCPQQQQPPPGGAAAAPSADSSAAAVDFESPAGRVRQWLLAGGGGGGGAGGLSGSPLRRHVTNSV